MRKLNEIFGYGLFIVGVAKIILVILVLLQAGTNIIAIFNGGSANSEYYPVFSLVIGFLQLILAIGSIIMIILNIKKQPQVIIGYLYGLGALLLEFVIPPIMSFYFVFVECGLYMKAGNKIRNVNWGLGKEEKINKKIIKNTDWFYSDKKEQRKGELEKENYESKELSDLMEVDETTYDIETNFMKENQITIILIILIIIIALGIGVFCWKVLQVEKAQNNIGIVDMYISSNNNNAINIDKNSTNNGEIKENIISSNSYINMSKYYLNSNLGKTAEIYNKMLDVLGTQTYISYYGVSNDKKGIFNRRHELDLKNFIEKYEGKSPGGKSIGYKYWVGTIETKYSYYEPRGTWVKSSLDWYTQANIIFSFMPLNVMITKQENYNIIYEENVIKDDKLYYKIVAEYCGIEEKKEKMTMYIEMESMKLKEVELISENKKINNYYFEYSDKVLKIPEEILNM